MTITRISGAMCPKWELSVGRFRISLAFISKHVRRYRFGLKLRGFGAGLACGLFCVTWDL